ncbi:hypothetical protein HRbin17_01841 [bacterium HR17]|uniref:Uncharacterized protein n=1 Tax=Candidatus Fervidibacter japonicus TaxID=2035412 RepID=A0A2H5XDR1_9BACT|nr:hypothetical protein HRbin17_01841 [bacterium HR17]
MTLVNDRLSAKIKLRVKVGNAVQQNACFASVNFVASDEISRCQVFNATQNKLLPLTVNQVSTDEPPTLVTIHIALTIVHAELVQRVVRVRVLSIEQQPSVCSLWVKYALFVQS